LETQAQIIARRLLKFAANVIRLIPALTKTMAGRHIAGQLMRSSASCGANYQEARAAESRADFIHKMQIVLKELRESDNWLKLIAEAELLTGSDLRSLLRESDELIRIIAKSVVSAKSKRESI
jgi:four helix bundle protein